MEVLPQIVHERVPIGPGQWNGRAEPVIVEGSVDHHLVSGEDYLPQVQGPVHPLQ